MRWRNSPDRFGASARLLHWLTVLLLIGSFGLGLYMVGLGFSPRQIEIYTWHKWIGVTVLGLTILRILWRRFDPSPALPGSMSALERTLARLSHAMLYVMLVVMPVTGWIMSSALGVPVVYLGVVELPDLVSADREFGEAMKVVHWGLSRLFLVLIALHVLAAFHHRLVRRDGVFERMVPALRKQPGHES